MKQTQTKPPNPTADTKASNSPTQQEAQNLQLFLGLFCSGSVTQHCEKWAVTLDEINELEAIQVCCSAGWGHKPVVHCRGLWCLAMAICPVLSLKSCRCSCLLCAVSHGIVSFIPPDGGFLLWMSVVKAKFSSTQAPSEQMCARAGWGTGGSSLYKAGEMGDGSAAWDRSHLGKQIFPYCWFPLRTSLLVKDVLKWFEGPQNWLRSDVLKVWLDVCSSFCIWWTPTVVCVALGRKVLNIFNSRVRLFCVYGTINAECSIS